MQKCGQLHASIAVALMAQSLLDAVWPTPATSRARTATKAVLCIGATPLSGDSMHLGASRCKKLCLALLGMRRVEMRRKLGLTGQEGDASSDQDGGDPTAAVNFFVKEDFGGESVADESERSCGGGD